MPPREMPEYSISVYDETGRKIGLASIVEISDLIIHRRRSQLTKSERRYRMKTIQENHLEKRSQMQLDYGVDGETVTYKQVYLLAPFLRGMKTVTITIKNSKEVMDAFEKAIRKGEII